MGMTSEWAILPAPFALSNLLSWLYLSLLIKLGPPRRSFIFLLFNLMIILEKSLFVEPFLEAMKSDWDIVSDLTTVGIASAHKLQKSRYRRMLSLSVSK